MAGSGRFLDNPLNWSFGVGRMFRIDIRVHVAFVLCGLWLIAEELRWYKEAGIPWTAGSLFGGALGIYAVLFLTVLLHEFGHCFGARYVGGEADEILIWPLGGLAMVSPPHEPRAHMITTVAGPLVNVVICALCTVILVTWMGSLGAVPWNPLSPMTPVDGTLTVSTAQNWVLRVYGISYILLLFNLLPVFPFDGGRILQAWLWPRKGFQQATLIATGVGMVGAVCLLLFGLFTDQSWLLLLLAAFGYFQCWQMRQAIRMGGYEGSEFGYDFSKGYGAFDDAPDRTRRPGFFERRRQRRAAARARRKREEGERRQEAIEAILKKVSEQGLRSLTARERRLLEEETRRRKERDSNPV